MSSGLRQLLRITFVLGFLVSAPTLVLYTAGYRVNFGNGRIVQTGILSLDSVPRGARVDVDGAQKGITPSLVKNLLPGPHVITLKKEGYLPWSKTLPVESKETTFVLDAVLYAQEPPRLLRETPIDGAVFDRASEQAAFVRRMDPWFETWAYDTRTDSDHLIARFPSKNASLPTLTWSPDGSALEIITDGGTFLVEVATGKRVEVTAAKKMRIGWWDTGSGLSYFAQTADGLWRIGLDGSMEKMSFSADAAMSTRNGILVAQPSQDRLAISLFHGSGPASILTYVPLGDYAFVSAPAAWILLHDRTHHRLLLLDTKNDAASLVLSTDALSWQWEPGGRRLLYTDGYGLHVFTPETSTDEVLTRLSEPLTGIAWQMGAHAVLYMQDLRLSAIEFDRRDMRRSTTLMEGQKIGRLWTDAHGRLAYFFGVIDGKQGLFAQTLVR